ncbi:40S ribosomal protein S3 [Chytriomyces hyalinus]|nr:40S ribosomal protein S3 [Chytriomyces hyalinus]
MHKRTVVLALQALLMATSVSANTEKLFIRTSADPRSEAWLSPAGNTGCMVPPFASVTLDGPASEVCLRGLTVDTQYELRVCWPATTPGDYVITADAEKGVVRVSVNSSGILSPGRDPVLYNQHRYHLILESTLLGVIPHSALPVVGLCLIVLAIALTVIAPAVDGLILSVGCKEEGDEKIDKDTFPKKQTHESSSALPLRNLDRPFFHYQNVSAAHAATPHVTPSQRTWHLHRIATHSSWSERPSQAAINKKRKFVADGVFFAELNSFLGKELAEQGYSGVEVRVTPTRTEIIIRATKTQDVLGDKGRRIRELTSVVQKRFNFPENTVELYAEKVAARGLSAIAQAESLRYKLIEGLAVRRACYAVMRFAMESGAKGVEVIVSGKLRGARAKAMKFVDGFMIHSGQPSIDFIDFATRNVLMRQGMIGIKVKIMLPAEYGKRGKMPLPDNVTILEPKEDVTPAAVPVAVPVATL